VDLICEPSTQQWILSILDKSNSTTTLLKSEEGSAQADEQEQKKEKAIRDTDTDACEVDGLMDTLACWRELSSNLNKSLLTVIRAPRSTLIAAEPYQEDDNSSIVIPLLKRGSIATTFSVVLKLESHKNIYYCTS
jgi:hypothetical protein